MSTATQTEPDADVQPGQHCTRCLAWRPIDQFRRRRKGTEERHEQCNACRRAKDEERGFRKRRSKHRKLVRTINKGTQGQAVRAVAECLIGFHDGVEGFCAEWHTHIQDAEPGSRWALNSFEAIGACFKSQVSCKSGSADDFVAKWRTWKIRSSQQTWTKSSPM